MSSHFLSLELELVPLPELQQVILAELCRYGEPLRWAIVAVDVERSKVQIEAVVTTEARFLVSALVRAV